MKVEFKYVGDKSEEKGSAPQFNWVRMGWRSDGHRFHPCGLRCYFGCSAGWVVLVREGEVPPSSFTAFMKFSPEAAWGNAAAISSDHSYLQVTEDKKPSQSVWYKCLSVLIFVYLIFLAIHLNLKKNFRCALLALPVAPSSQLNPKTQFWRRDTSQEM